LSDKDKILEFPTATPVGDEEETPIKEQLEGAAKDTMDELQGDDEEFFCKACETEHTENVLPLTILLFAGQDQSGRTSTAPVTLFVCPNCKTLSMPEEVFEAIIKQSESNLILPTGPANI
jgi:hypothetical protein